MGHLVFYLATPSRRMVLVPYFLLKPSQSFSFTGGTSVVMRQSQRWKRPWGFCVKCTSPEWMMGQTQRPSHPTPNQAQMARVGHVTAPVCGRWFALYFHSHLHMNLKTVYVAFRNYILICCYAMSPLQEKNFI